MKSASEYEDYDSSNPDSILTISDACINAWNGYSSTAMATAKFMRTFQYVDAWTAGERRLRGRRATLDFNNLQAIIRSLLTEQREADPQIELMPVNVMVDPKVISTRTDALRYISFKSNAKMVYQTAYKDALDCGWGAMMVDVDYAGPDTFDQVGMLKAIKDVLTCGWDPNAEHPNKTDGEFCFFTTTMARKEFKRQFKDKDVALATAPVTSNTQSYGFIQDDMTAYITTYFYKEYFNKTVSLLENGKSYTKENYKKYTSSMKKKRKNVLRMKNRLPPEVFDELIELTEISPVKETRQATDFRIKKCLRSTGEILEISDFPGKLMPLIYVEGFSSIIDGRQIPIPFAKCAVDSQRAMNYAGSEMADAMTKARKEQWLVTAKQREGAETTWSHPENIQGSLTYNPDPRVPGGAPIPVQSAPVLNPQYQQYYQQMQSDVRTITGRYAENAGDGSETQSGKSVLAKQTAGNLTVGVYADNLMDAIAEAGRVLNGIMSEVYDTDREITLLGKDKNTRIERINYFGDIPKYNEEEDDDEYETINDMTKGEFEVSISAGGSFAAQQQIAFQQAMQFLGASQAPLFPYLADKLAELIDIPQSNEIAKRMTNFIVPPAVVAMDKNEPPPPPPPPTQQEQLQQAQIQAEMESIKAENIKSHATIANAISNVMIQKSKERAEKLSAVAEIDKAVTSADAQSVESISRVTQSVINADNARLKKENEVYRKIFEGINP